jgi:hypothetical protein
MMTIISAIMTLNPIAILVALISHFTIGAIWYHPSVFGKAWIALRGMVTKPDTKWILVGIVAHVIYTFVLAVVVNLAQATMVLEGLAIGIMVSVGFIGTMLINELIYGKLPFKLFLIKIGDETISLCVAGIILALWK